MNFLVNIEKRMENLKQRINQCLLSFSSPERFSFLRVLGKTWEEKMKQESKIPVFDIEIALPPNFSGISVTLLENNHFQASNIGIAFQASFKMPANKNADEKGLVHKYGRCKGTIIGEYLYADSQLYILSTTPIEFNHEKMPEWVDKGNYFDISDWIDYYQQYLFSLSLSITKWFGVTVRTAQEWIEEQIIPKTFQDKKNAFDRKYRHVHNIADKMFRKAQYREYFRRRFMMTIKETTEKANGLFYEDMIDTLTDKLLLSEINDIAYTVMQTEEIIIPGKFIDGIDHLDQKIKKALWPMENVPLEASICSSVIHAFKFRKLFSKRSGPLENDPDRKEMSSEEYYKNYRKLEYGQFHRKFDPSDPKRENANDEFFAELKQMSSEFCLLLKSLNWFADIVRAEYDPIFFKINGKFIGNNISIGSPIGDKYDFSEEEKAETIEQYKRTIL